MFAIGPQSPVSTRVAASCQSARALRVQAAATPGGRSGDSRPCQSVEAHGVQRRQALQLSVSAALAAAGLSWTPSAAAEPGANPVTGTREPLTLAQPTQTEGFLEVEDGTLAYKFVYPVQTATGRALPIIFSRRPERYSSAAPLTPDARQRIVCSLVSLADGVTYTVTVGPAAGVLKDVKPDSWRPRQVAETVLIDRSTARTTTGQRVALNDVEKADAETRGGETYWVYEHRSQGSPNPGDNSPETFRHAYAVTTVRPASDGTLYLYTLNMACPERVWPELAPLFQKSIDSFLLTPPTKEYVAPDVEPWRFF